MDRIEPFDVPNSYLVHKVEGTQASVGGFGEQMPLVGAALAATHINDIKTWINDGAPP